MFTKVVQTGTMLEVYTYQYEPVPYVQRKKVDKSRWESWLLKYKTRSKRSAKRAKKSFVRLVRANLVGEPPCMLTLTNRDIPTVKVAYTRFTAFMLRMRRRVSMDLRFIAVLEFQKRGSIHYHVLIWGIPTIMQSSERSTRFLADMWGHGFVDIISTDGSVKLAHYLGKYLSKGMQDDRLAGHKAYTSSRNCNRPVSVSSIKNPVAVDFILNDFGVISSVDKPLDPIVDRTYTTQWLGTANYKKYSDIKNI